MRTRAAVSYELDPGHPAPLTVAQQAELEALAALLEERIDTSDIPRLPETFWKQAVWNPLCRPVDSS